MDSLKDFLLNLLISSFNMCDGWINTAKAALSGGGLNVDVVWNAVGTIKDVLAPFCYIVIGICLLIELANVAQKVDAVKWEHGLKICIKMVLAKVCIDIAPVFLRACYLQANKWIAGISEIGNYSSLGNILIDPLRDQFDGISGMFSLIVFSALCNMILFGIIIANLLVLVIAIGRMFEIFVYLSVSPLACAFFPLGDGTGGGVSRITMRYFRSFIAVCLQGVMILICIQLFFIIIGTQFSTAIDNLANSGGGGFSVIIGMLMNMLLYSIVLVMSVSRCGTWAKSIMDAA